MKSSNYYVYALLDPRRKGLFNYGIISFEFEPFYIGMGKDDRWCHHENEAIDGLNLENSSKINKIKSIISNSLVGPIHVKCAEHLCRKLACEIEIRLIESIGRLTLGNGPLTNIQGGGDGGWKHVNSDPNIRDKCNISIRKSAKRLWIDPEFRKIQCSSRSRIMTRLNQNPEFRLKADENRRKNGQKSVDRLLSVVRSREFRDRRRKFFVELNKDESIKTANRQRLLSFNKDVCFSKRRKGQILEIVIPYLSKFKVWISQGRSLQSIANELNDCGTLGRGGRKWSANMIKTAIHFLGLELRNAKVQKQS